MDLRGAAFAYAWKQICDIDTDIDTMQHHGMTDGLILVGMLEQHGISNEEVQLSSHCRTDKYHQNDGHVCLPYPRLLRNTAAMQGMKRLDAMRQAMVDYFTQHNSEAGHGLELLPGILELLQALQVPAWWSA